MGLRKIYFFGGYEIFMVFSNDFEGIFHASDSMKMPLRKFLSMFIVNVRESPIKT